MDLLDPNTWKQQWELIRNAPYLLIPSLVLALAAGWWLGNRLAAAKVEGLKATIENLNTRIAGLKEDLGRVRQREEDVRQANARLEKYFDKLNTLIVTNAPREELIPVLRKVDVAVTESSTANNALGAALTALDLTTGAPEIGKPPLSTQKKSSARK
jgi:outer membrane murein-binding lipoprotein Lpp